MKDTNKVALAAAVAGGYVLGRTKKGRMALAVGTYLAGRRTGLDPQKLMAQGMKTLKDAPQLAGLGDQVRGELLDAGRQALAATADRKMAGLADALHERTMRLEGREEADEKDQRGTEAADRADEPEADQEEPEKEQEEQEEPAKEQEEQEEPAKEQEPEGARGEHRSRRAAAGKTAKKATAGPSTAKKATARAAAKKAATTGKAPAKRARSGTDATSGSGTRRR
ncbi:histone protein [Streptomyces pristinaespiralis]|uniref:histone protein n=1 Tax=Streptomyces pristinaespiralis TaxID=38300 RepID=UPI00383489C6